ncbi:nijmegen breakage syndrome 1 protein isoform X5 [Rosa chinensis]|uniref:nijmegen breakage syndrome 1 protein isoform X5 n=1 Tax=Rosa chinensis TaxID=74649 RepID=UPI000D09010C|nr:nijmegen breakage syndrome 1 protein isoform X5 [Rosa chinensis]
MVWGFFPADPLAGEHTYYIFATGTYKVGRKGCDVNIAKDKGVSRVHAEIIVDSMISALPRQTKSSVLSSKVRIRDCSKYGTYINKNLTSVEKIHELPNKETSLRDGDMVSFGTGTAVFRFSFVPLILFACCPENSRVNHPLQEKISSIGARITYHWSQECTHVLVDQVMPMKEDLLDGIMEKKPFVVGSWVELFSNNDHGRNIGQTCGPKKSRKLFKRYKFGDRLQSLLEVSGAEILLIEGFKSKSQIPDCAVSDRVVCVVPERVSDDCSDKLGSLLRVNELGLLCAILNGRLDPCMLKSPCVVVSSSCSTDETVVADSDVEETATSVLATASVGTGVVENVPHAVTKSENNFVMSSRRSSDISTIRGKLDDSESGIADIIYSQDLIARDKSIPCTVVTSANNRFINFKRFRKTNTQSGNSFNNLIPFSKDPYNESDYGSEEVVQSVTDEKRRKHMEAISEELFNNEQGRRRGVAGSLRGILSHGK